jgi:secreted Zn-dependent insulinase-like peptidase
LRPLFERHRGALANRLQEAPKNLGEASARRWQDLNNGYRGFDSREQLLAAVQGLTFEQWLACFRRDVLAEGGHALWLSADGRFAEARLERGQPLGDLEKFKAGQQFYRFP